MQERAYAKMFGRLHLHPVESRLCDGDIEGTEAAILQWGLPPNMEMLAAFLVDRNEGAKRLGFIEVLLALHQDGVVPKSSLQEFLGCLLLTKSFGNRKLLTKLLASTFELTKQTAPSVLDKPLTDRIIHMALVNESDDLLRAVGIEENSLEPTAPVMFALVDACVLSAFRWVKPFDQWSNPQQTDFLDLFMAQCVRRHPSNKRQGEVLDLLLAKGILPDFQFTERDICTKESVRSTILSLRIVVDPKLIKKAPLPFRMAMVKAGLFTTAKANVKGKTIDKMMAIDLGL